jgi:hypothetical protein
MKKFLLLFMLLFSLGVGAQDFLQEDKPEPEKKMQLSDKLFFGGGFGMAFGTITNIEVSPLAGFRITDDWMVGGGFSYQYFNRRYDDLSTSIFGPRVFTNYMLIGDFFAHLEYEALSLETALFYYPGNSSRFWVESYLVGGGYRMSISDKSSVNIMLLYNLNETIYTPYSNPIIRIGFYL